MPVLRAVAATLLLMMFTGASAYAQNTIYGCVDGRNKVRRIMTSPPTCRATETPLSWNQVGPQGPAGTPGLPGPGLTMKDANGSMVGLVLAPRSFRLASSGMWVIRNLAGVEAVLLAFTDIRARWRLT